MAQRRKYSRFADRIDVDAFEQAIGFDAVEGTGDEDTGYCFDWFNLHTHGDTTGKLSLNREKRVYNCWVCGGGSFLDLAMLQMDMDSEDATDWLYQFVDSEESEDESADRLKGKLYKQEEREETVLPFFNPHALDRWETEHPWFESRGIDATTVKIYQLRYAAQQMKRPPQKPKYEDEEPYIGPAIVLPHFWQGKLVGWQNRWLDDDRPDWVKKYTNTSDFPKDETIFNYDRVVGSEEPVVVLESVSSVLFLEAIGVPAVSTFGSSFSDLQVKILRTLRQGIIPAPDADMDGLKYQKLLTQRLRRYIDVYQIDPVGKIGSKKDLGDLAPDADAVYERLAAAELAGLSL